MTKHGDRHLRAVHEDWRAVAAALGVRMSTRRVSQQELALAAGVSVTTVRVLQRGNGDRRVQNSTLSAVSRALAWPDDHLFRVLLGDRYPDAGAGATPTARPRGEASASERSADTAAIDAIEPPAGGGTAGGAGEYGGPRVRVTRQPALTGQPDVALQILRTLRRIERRVDDIARHVLSA